MGTLKLDSVTPLPCWKKLVDIGEVCDAQLTALKCFGSKSSGPQCDVLVRWQRTFKTVVPALVTVYLKTLECYAGVNHKYQALVEGTRRALTCFSLGEVVDALVAGGDASAWVLGTCVSQSLQLLCAFVPTLSPCDALCLESSALQRRKLVGWWSDPTNPTRAAITRFVLECRSRGCELGEWLLGQAIRYDNRDVVVLDKVQALEASMATALKAPWFGVGAGEEEDRDDSVDMRAVRTAVKRAFDAFGAAVLERAMQRA